MGVIRLKIKDYGQFIKFRLSFTVVISAISGFLFAGGGTWLEAIFLMIGGLLVTGSSIGSNQIWERKLDAQMPRTEGRPIPQGRMSLTEAVLIVVIALFVGLWMLWQLNLNTMLLGLISYLLYTFVYTPMKRISPWATVVGAIPGAFPPMIGAIAVTNSFGPMPGALYFVQFVWQLPHFWAIAWVSHDDYQKAGFSLLPSRSGRTKKSAYIIMITSLILIPFSLFPWVLSPWNVDGLEIGLGGFTLIVGTLLGMLFFLAAYKLYLSLDIKDARRLMFASFIYLPLIQFVYVIDSYFFFT